MPKLYVVEADKSISKYAEKLVMLIKNQAVDVVFFTLDEYQKVRSVADIVYSDGVRFIFIGATKLGMFGVPNIPSWQYERFGCRIGWVGNKCVIFAKNSDLSHDELTDFKAYCHDMQLNNSDVITPPPTLEAQYSTLLIEFMEKHFSEFINTEVDGSEEPIGDDELKPMLEKAENIVATAVAATTATGAIPIPFADAPLLIGEQVAMMLAINVIFEFDVSKEALKSLATAAIGVGGATVLGKTIVSNALKFIPGVGSVAGGAISAATAGLITLALGKAYIQVCKAIKMGELNQDDLTRKAGADALKAAFKEQLEKNKKK